MRWLALAVSLLLFGCNDIVGPGGTPRERLNAEIIGVYECLNPSSVGCQRGERILRPLSGVPFVAVARVDYARQIWWFLEWERCRAIQVCSSTRRIGPLNLAEGRELELALVLRDDRDWWLIIRAEMEPEVTADTLFVTWPNGS